MYVFGKHYALAAMGALRLLSYAPDTEPNDDPAHAVPVTLPLVEAQGCITPATDIDYFTFTTRRPQPLWVSARGRGQGQLGLALLDARYSVVGEDVDLLTLDEVPQGTYYLRIYSLEEDCYELNISSDARLPPVG